MRKNKKKLNTASNSHNAINVTPFIDVVLVLLIIFMVATPMIVSGLKLDLPDGNEYIESTEREQSVVISLDKNGAISIEDINVTSGNLFSTLRKLSNDKKDKQILIRAERILQYGYIMEFVDKIKKSGYKNVVLVTSDEK